MTKYCKICAFCVIDGEYYCCCMHGRTKTERQICHTTNCKDFALTGDGVDIVTGRAYKPHKRKPMCNDFFTVNKHNTLAQLIARGLHGLARRIAGVANG